MDKSKKEEAQKRKYQQMTEAPIKGLVCKMAVPTIISMMITSIYNMADTFFVGRLGTSAIGAVGVVFAVMVIIQAIGFFFGQGSGNYISRRLGEKKTEEAARMAATGFFTALGVGVVLAVLGLCFLKPLCRLLGATDTILPYAMDYMRFILIGAPYMTASLVLNNQLRLQGNAFYAMVGLASGGVLNIALDPILIFGLHMGISGAAVATIFSQLVSFCLLLRGCFASGGIRIQLRNFSPSLARYRSIVGGGLPSLCRQGLGSIAMICLNTAAGSFGDAAIAAMSIVTRVLQFASSALIGFGQGFQPVCGFNYGAGKYDRVKQAYWFCVGVATILLIVLAVVGIIFAPSIITLFRADDEAVISMGALALRLQCFALPFFGFSIMGNMLLQITAKTVRATILAMARQGLFFLPLIFILPLHLGILGVQLCQPISDVLMFLLAIPLTASLLRELDRAAVSAP